MKAGRYNYNCLIIYRKAIVSLSGEHSHFYKATFNNSSSLPGFSQLSLPSSNFLKISVAEKMQESMIPATVKVPPTIAQMVVRKW